MTTPSTEPASAFLRRAAAILARQVELMQRAPGNSPAGALPVASAPIARDVPAGDPLAPLNAPLVDEVRRQGSALIEALITAFGEAHAPAGDTYEQVPLIRCLAPVAAGTAASAVLKVTNEEGTPSRVVLYSTNFVSDSGYELPSLCVSVMPRQAQVPAGGEVTFELTIAVPAQAPRGTYSGLVSATGCKYVKAVVLLDVL